MADTAGAALDLEALRSFVIIVQQGSLAAAAEQRHRTVSALSMQIKRLEERLDSRLLIRGPRGVAPSPAGEMLLREARELLRQHDGLIARLTGQGLSGRVRFGMPEGYAPQLVEQVLPDFLASHPNVLLEAVTAPSGELARRLERGELSLAVALDRPHRLAGGEPLWKASPVWAAARDFTVDPDAPLPLALHPLDCPFRSLGVEALEARGRAWNAVFTSTSIHALEQAVAVGLAVSILDRQRLLLSMRVLDESDGLPELSESQACLYFSRRIGAASWPAIQALADMLRERLARVGPWPGTRARARADPYAQ
ncbi:MAG TPA: LysR family transcriptional regulator [Halomonas sp.]|nr:LysR family transcriptional regulator [Halomonas sp.]